MAAATVASQERPHALGDIKLIVVSFTALADTNTYTLPLGSRILGAKVIQCVGSPSIQCTVALNVITFNVSAGTPNCTVAIYVA